MSLKYEPASEPLQISDHECTDDTALRSVTSTEQLLDVLNTLEEVPTPYTLHPTPHTLHPTTEEVCPLSILRTTFFFITIKPGVE